ncbi:uncharacterized protein LOC135223992 [Macrobrachium nipponense]|uniref:uncharacterized protein LOC135223992 n=1 Tax=Macrobrachium nipponense TaxID=159736 RepID=UPI0030C863F2
MAKPHRIGFYIRDVISGCRMLVDTRAMQSVFLQSGDDRSHTPDITTALVAANGTPICSYSTKSLKISILGCNYVWQFIIVDVKASLLGADFLEQHRLLVDVGRKRLLDTGTCLSLPLAAGPGIPTICSIAPQIWQPPAGVPNVFKQELRQAAGTLAKHGVCHHITTMGPTHTCKVLPTSTEPPSGCQEGPRRD